MERGHPWIYREETSRSEPGTVVELLDGQGKRLGWGLTDEGPIAVRVLGRGAREPIERLVAGRIAAADAMRADLVSECSDAYRIVNGAGDGLDGLVVDRYADLAVLRVYAGAWEPHLGAVISAIAALPWCTTVVRRLGVERVDGQQGAEVVSGPAPAEVVVVTEHGMRLLVRWREGQKTGMFLDQRENRALVGRWARGRSVVNLFSYTGGFSVAAALGGAERVISVDLAPGAIEDARENFRLNGIDPDRHGFEVADAFTWRAPSPQALTVIDPPSLARDRASVDAALSAYRKLHRHYGGQVPVGGLLATSSCTARIALADWRAAIAGGLPGQREWSWLHVGGSPVDHPVALGHPEGEYLKFALLVCRG